MNIPENPGFVAAHDERDKHHTMQMVFAAQKTPEELLNRTRSVPYILDQGMEPSCVGHGFAYALAMSPKPRRVNPVWLYGECKKIDGNQNPGTSLHSALKVLKREGLIASYDWAQSVEDVIRYIVHIGPVVFGTVWTEGMNFPDHEQRLQVDHYDTPIGHCWLGNAVNLEREELGMVTSYGTKWGAEGHARIKFSELERLFKRGAQAVAITKA